MADGGDGWERPLFDDDFVQAAQFREGDRWRTGTGVPTPPVPPPAPPSRATSAGRHRRAVALFIVGFTSVMLLALLAVGSVVQGRGGHGGNHRANAADGSVPSTTEPVFHVNSVPPGSCITWRYGTQAPHPVVVGCDHPHLAELVQEVTADTGSAAYPSVAVRKRTIGRQCSPPVNAYLGYPIWSDSRFSANAFFPIASDWAQGSRLMYCYVHERADSAGLYRANRFPLYTGRVKGQPQDQLRPTGTCLARVEVNLFLRTSCRGAYDGQVTGSIDTRRLPHPPTDVVSADQVTSALCQSITYEFRQHRPLPAAAEVWSTIGADDWADGQRIVECWWAYPDGHPSPPPTTRPGRATTRPASSSSTTAP